MNQVEFQAINEEYWKEIAALTHYLNPKLELELLEERVQDMFNHSHYYCFGIFHDKKLIGVASGWITVRLYSGQQYELDNVIIHPDYQSMGIGAEFIQYLEDFAYDNDCETVELNAYIENEKAHAFYERLGYRKLGFHMQKRIK